MALTYTEAASRPHQSPWQSWLHLFQAVATAGALVQLMNAGLSWTLLVILGGLAALQIGGYVAHARGAHALREGTPRFARFFTNWYSQPGQHTVFCDDLDWLARPEHTSVVGAMAKRGRSMEVFVRDDSSPVCDRLRRHGVTVSTVPSATMTCSAMSLHVFEGVSTVIIRHKSRGPVHRRRVRFIETRDPYLLALVGDFFRVLRSPNLRERVTKLMTRR